MSQLAIVIKFVTNITIDKSGNDRRWRLRFIILVFVGPSRTAERGGRRGHCPGARGHRGTGGSELSGLECKIHQLKLRPAGAMMLLFDFGPKFEHPRTL